MQPSGSATVCMYDIIIILYVINMALSLVVIIVLTGTLQCNN